MSAMGKQGGKRVSGGRPSAAAAANAVDSGPSAGVPSGV